MFFYFLWCNSWCTHDPACHSRMLVPGKSWHQLEVVALTVVVICSSPSLHTHSCVCCEDAVPLPPSLLSPLDQDERENCKIQILRYVIVGIPDEICANCLYWQRFFIPPLPPSPHSLFLLLPALSWPSECFRGYGLVLWCPSSLHHCQVSELLKYVIFNQSHNLN